MISVCSNWFNSSKSYSFVIMITATRTTFEQFCIDANQYYLDNKNDLRYGQAIVNYLAVVRPDLNVRVPMDSDCFYNDGLTNQFLYWVSENWN